MRRRGQPHLGAGLEDFFWMFLVIAIGIAAQAAGLYLAVLFTP